MYGARRMLSALALLALALAPGAAGAAEDTQVIVTDSYYIPEVVTVEAGTTVVWKQQGNLPHTVTAEDGSFDSHPACPTLPGSCMEDGDTYTRAFNQPGTFLYYCKLHASPGSRSGMVGEVRVVDENGMVATTITGLSATNGTGTVSVSGMAEFGGQAPLTVGTDPSGDSTQPSALGYDLTRAQIGQPDPNTGDLVFSLDLSDLPPTGGIPEAARYTWDFAVNPGGGTPTPFEIDGKLTDVIRRQSTRMPSFVLRGGCATVDNVITCTDVATLDATMDAAADRITVTVPRALLEAQTKAPLAGTTIEPATICEGITSKASAYFSLCGGPGTATGDALIQDPELDVYRVASPSVELGIVPAGATPSYSVNAEVAEGGTFAGTLDTSGLAPGTYDVVARACFGTNCATRSVPITL